MLDGGLKFPLLAHRGARGPKMVLSLYAGGVGGNFVSLGISDN